MAVVMDALGYAAPVYSGGFCLQPEIAEKSPIRLGLQAERLVQVFNSRETR